MSAPEPIPFLDLAVENAPLQDEIAAAIRRVSDSGRFVLGPEVEAFEREFADYCGVDHAVGCASGSDALLLALMALDVAPGDQVVCPSYTFFATGSAITRLGATPVFADIDRRTFNLDVEQTRKASARCSRLRALVPVDLFGQLVDIRGFESLAAELGVPIVADTAQSVGAVDATGRKAGSTGAVSCFSLYPTKNLGAFGDAGILCTSRGDLAERLRSLREHGAQERYFHREVGINSRLDAVQAAVLRVKLRHLDGWNETRRRHAARYDRCFAEADPAGRITPPATEADEGSHVYHQYAIRVPADVRDPLRQALAEQGIGSQIYYPLGLHQQECNESLGYVEGDLPETEAAARETLCLPIYPSLTNGQIERVVETVVEAVARLAA